MKAPSCIQKELSLINSMYFCIYNPEKERWQVRKWLGVFPKKLYLWREFSENILTICREEYVQYKDKWTVETSDVDFENEDEVIEDEDPREVGLQDVGYMDVDMRTVDAIRESHWFKLKWKKKIAEMDWRNDRRELQAQDEFEYQAKYVAKRVWRSMHEPTVCLSGKEWRR